MCLQPSTWLTKVTQGPIVGQTLRFGASVSFLGLQVSICTVEFSVYYSTPRCTFCGATQDTWVIRTLYDPPAYCNVLYKVKATTFILLFGVGSFLCYKVFHRLRQRARKPKQPTHSLLKEVDAESEISEESVECHYSSGSIGDGESSSDSLSLSDCGKEDLDDVMGVTSSNPLEPVFFNKSSGIHFQRPFRSPPVDVLGESLHQQRCSWLEQSHDTSFSYEGAASLRGNFSPGSLQERTRRTQEYLESSGDEFYSDSHLPHCADSATDSIVFYSEKCYPIYRQASVDSEEMGADLQRKVEAIGKATVQKMENLDMQLQELKQTVLELDADIVGLKVYRPPPKQCWELTNISSSSETGSGIVDVIQHHWTKVWCKGLAEPQFPNDETWESIAKNILDWDYVAENSHDSGSDFGNSFDTDSVEPESNSVLLDWDPTCFPEGLSLDTVDAVVHKPEIRKRKMQMLSKSMSEDSNLRSVWTKQHRSMSMPSQMLAQQIKSVIKTPSSAACTDKLEPCGLAASGSAGSFVESGVQDLTKLPKEAGNGSPSDVMKLSGLNWDSAYCEGTEELTMDAVGEKIPLSTFHGHIGNDEVWTKFSEQLELEKQFRSVRCIRNDGYCILRSSLFLCLCNRKSILYHYGTANAVNELLVKWSHGLCPWLNEWSYGGRLQYNGVEGFLDCLSTLEKLEGNIQEIRNVEDIQDLLTKILNSDVMMDTKVMEALKLLMVISAVKLREAGHHAPVFFNLLFAQLEPSWPLNKLDCIGSIGASFKQADFYLLGYTLLSTLRILRLQRLEETDFVCYYPECNLGQWPEITLLLMESDSRCYVLVT